MVGSAATSMASIVNRRIDISPPKAFTTSLDQNDFADFNVLERIVKISFKMEIGNLINSEIMQLLPLDFAKEMVSGLLIEEAEAIAEFPDIGIRENNAQGYSQQQGIEQSAASQMASHQMYTEKVPNSVPPQYSNAQPQPNVGYPQGQPMGGFNQQQQPVQNQIHMVSNNQQQPVNIQPIQFQSFDEGRGSSQKGNINLLLEVPLQVTVELGRTQKLIKDILEFAPGSIIELDKLAGEQVDILVNGKIIAKGEVVIIDESFGVRVTDIVQPSKRL